MASIHTLILEVADPRSAGPTYTDALGLDEFVRLRQSEAPTNGFRGFTLSLLVSQPADVNGLVDAAVDCGAEVLKPASASLWGYGGAVRAQDGTIVTVASSSKKDTGPRTREINEVVLQLGVTDVAASKQFYVDQGLEVSKSYGRKYVQFSMASGPATLALYKRRGLAKVVGVSPEGTGAHRLAIGSDVGPFTDPDGFVWEAAQPRLTPTG